MSTAQLISTILYYAAAFIAVIFVLVPHEFAHAFVAYKNGDWTAKINGRLTLNPLKHLDPLGLVMVALVGFGWAKPVPIDSRNFKNYKVGLFTTAIAGICANLIIAFIVYPLYRVCVIYLPSNYGTYFLEMLLQLIFSYSLSIAVFNLIPLYPLDGFRIVESLTKTYNRGRRFLERYGQWILLGLIAESFICGILENYIAVFGYLDILGYVMQFAVRIVGYPITALWGLIL
ncbi:MAG: site-2 protease family protein [Clostridia bacterium]|nr:site-2 protease family protein [Clostridia bacterium]